MVKEFKRGGATGGRGRGRGNNRGRVKQDWNAPPDAVCEVGKAMHPVEEFILVKNELKDKVPIFGRPVYINEKKKIGLIDDVLGPINEFMFSVKCDPEIKPNSIKLGEKIYMNVEHFLPFERFLPKKPGEKQKGQKGAGKGRGGFKGQRGQRGFRPQRETGGYRPSRGGSSGGYRPPRGGQKK